jgi:protein ImuB
MNERTLTLWWSGWPVVAARAAAGPGAIDPGQAAMVVRANRVIACSPAAAAAGVQRGQRRRVAQQRCPEAVLLDDDPDRDARLFEPVVQAIERFTPRLDVVEPGWLAIATRGPSRYFGGDQRLAEQIVADVAELVGEIDGYGVGIADGRFASATAARRAADATVPPARPGRGGTSSRRQGDRIEIVEPGATAAFLAPLAIDWLADTGGVDPGLVGLFARLGLLTLGDLADLAATDVTARFGPDGGRAHALASGTDETALQTRVPTPLRAVERAFDEPVLQLEPLVFVGKQLADELVDDLEAAGLSCVRLAVTAETEHGERSERSWYRAGGLSPLAMVERVRWQLDGWVNGTSMSVGTGSASSAPSAITAGVVLLRLDPVELRPSGGDQQALWGGTSAADERAARAIAHLAGIVGEEAVKVPAWQGGRLPGDRYRWIPATTVDVTDPDDTAERLRPPIAQTHPWPGAIPAPSPAMVLDRSTGERPPAAELVDADGCPVTVNGRGMISAAPAAITVGSHRPQTVVAWAGPWPLDERWWDTRRHRRLARLQVVTDDGTARLLAARRGRWWVLATYL